MAKEKRCDLIELYDLLGKKWTVALFHHITDEPISFNELRRVTSGFISPILLSRRLKKMIDFKLIKKRKINNKLVYQITEEGKEVKDIMHKLKKWAIKNNFRLPQECDESTCYCDYLFCKS